ncbi:MAG: DUF3047 domain-containing protein [Pseudomonadota bacterium]
MKPYVKAIALSAAVMAVPAPAFATDAEPMVRPVDMMRWQERIFRNSTVYRSVVLDGERVLRGEADDSASALYQTQRINLTETPYLHWRWRVERTLGSEIDERSKNGDDYAARVYVIRDGGLTFWRPKSISYVWSSNIPAGTHWANPYGGENVHMWALDSGNAKAGEWSSHVRDIRADWLEAFGEDIRSLDGLAVMVDTDNSGLTSRSWFADILFSSKP